MLPWLVTVLARYSAWKACVSTQPMHGSHEDCIPSAGTGFCLLFLPNLIQFPATVLLQTRLCQKPQRLELDAANGSAAEDPCRAWPLGGGLFHTLRSAGFPRTGTVACSNNSYSLHLCYQFYRFTILRHILKFWRMLYWCPPLGSAWPYHLPWFLTLKGTRTVFTLCHTI